MFPFCFVLRTMITHSALIVLHDFTSAERVLNIGSLFFLFSISKSYSYPTFYLLTHFNPNWLLEKSTIFLLENSVFSSNKEVTIIYNAKKQRRVLTY